MEHNILKACLKWENSCNMIKGEENIQTKNVHIQYIYTYVYMCIYMCVYI